MRVARDGIWLCVDCLMVAVNGDASGIESDEQIERTEAGLDKLGTHLVPDFDSETGQGILEFSNSGCDCCGSRLAGELHAFAILEPVSDADQFVRLLAEINAVGLTPRQLRGLSKSMDLSVTGIREILSRAEQAFEKLKEQQL